MSYVNEFALRDRIHTFFRKKPEIIHIKKGSLLFGESTLASHLYFILDGKIEIIKTVPDGRELTMRVCSRNDLVGETALFSSNSQYMVSAKVIEDGNCAVLPKTDFEEEIAADSHLAVEMMSWLSFLNRQNQSKFRDMLLHGKKGALYSTLIRLTNSYGNPTNEGVLINIPMTNTDLANFCGTSREVVNRMLSPLKKDGILSIQKGYITVHDLDFLKREINCENCPIEVCSIN